MSNFTTQCSAELPTTATAPQDIVAKELPPVKLPHDQIFGLPPHLTLQDDPSLLKRFRILELTPCKPVMISSVWKYQYQPDWGKFNDRLKVLLQNLGISATSLNAIKFVVDVEDVEISLQNQYETNILARTVNWAGSLGRQLQQMGGYVDTGVLSALFDKALKFIQNFANIDSTIMNAMVGRVNLPMVWESSSFSQDYNFTAKLVCDGSVESFKQNVMLPLSVLFTLVCPIVMRGGIAYGSPLFVSAFVPGVIKLNAAMLSLTVEKPGTWIYKDHKLWGVKVTLHLHSVYSTMLRERVFDSSQPSVADLMEAFNSSWRK